MQIKVNFKPLDSNDEIPVDWAQEREFGKVRNIVLTLKDGTKITVEERNGLFTVTGSAPMVIAPELSNRVAIKVVSV